MVPGFDPHLEQLSFVIIELSDDCQHIHTQTLVAQSSPNSRKRHLMGIPQFHHELCRSGIRLSIRMIPNWIGTIRSAIGIRKIKVFPNWIRTIRDTIVWVYFFDSTHFRGQGRNPSENFGHFWSNAMEFQEKFLTFSAYLSSIHNTMF